LADPPRPDWDLSHPFEFEDRVVSIVLPFRPYHESTGVGTDASAAGTADLFIPFERDPARRFLWSRLRGIGSEIRVSGQNQMDD
jgi:hypothetical protein